MGTARDNGRRGGEGLDVPTSGNEPLSDEDKDRLMREAFERNPGAPLYYIRESDIDSGP